MSAGKARALSTANFYITTTYNWAALLGGHSEALHTPHTTPITWCAPGKFPRRVVRGLSSPSTTSDWKAVIVLLMIMWKYAMDRPRQVSARERIVEPTLLPWPPVGVIFGFASDLTHSSAIKDSKHNILSLLRAVSMHDAKVVKWFFPP